MKHLFLLLTPLTVLCLACGDDPSADSDVGADGVDMSDVPDATEDQGDTADASGQIQPIIERTFDPPTPFAEPIQDYIEAGLAAFGEDGFRRAIHDLAVHEERMYIGYGDADSNMGRQIPITFRYFASPENPEVSVGFVSDDEHLDHYRHIGNDLFMAGVDSSSDAWLGNVYYRRPGSDFAMSRTLEGGVHVQDVVGFVGNVYAVGSGATQTAEAIIYDFPNGVLNGDRGLRQGQT